jgi:hypothetical protein
MGGKCVELVGDHLEVRSRTEKKTANLAFGHCRERLFDFILVATAQNQNGLSDRPGGCFNLAEILWRRLVLRTDEKGDQTGLREDFAQQFKRLGFTSIPGA